MDRFAINLLSNLDKFQPLFLVMIGYLLRRFAVLEKDIAGALIRLVFYVFLPASIFYSLVQLELAAGLLILPLAGFLVSLSCYVFGFLVRGLLGMDKRTTGSFLIACGSMNQGMFAYPFFLMYLGTLGLSYVAFYDVGQVVLALTLAYYISVRYGDTPVSYRRMASKMLQFPLLWAFVLALLVNYAGFLREIEPVMPMVIMLHNCTIPIVMLSLGVFLEPGLRKWKPIAGVIFTRFVYSLAAAFILASLLNVEGLARTTILIASVVPPAMITLIYSVEEGLDVEYTSELLSVCIMIGLVYTPLLFTLLL